MDADLQHEPESVPAVARAIPDTVSCCCFEAALVVVLLRVPFAFLPSCLLSADHCCLFLRLDGCVFS